MKYINKSFYKQHIYSLCHTDRFTVIFTTSILITSERKIYCIKMPLGLFSGKRVARTMQYIICLHESVQGKGFIFQPAKALQRRPRQNSFLMQCFATITSTIITPIRCKSITFASVRTQILFFFYGIVHKFWHRDQNERSGMLIHLQYLFIHYHLRVSAFFGIAIFLGSTDSQMLVEKSILWWHCRCDSFCHHNSDFRARTFWKLKQTMMHDDSFSKSYAEVRMFC